MTKKQIFKKVSLLLALLVFAPIAMADGQGGNDQKRDPQPEKNDLRDDRVQMRPSDGAGAN